MTRSVDVVVIGGGIAGVAAACELTMAGRSVLLVEQEPQLAHHTTGRSASVFLESYGPPPVRALSKASRSMYDDAPQRLGCTTLLSNRPSVWLAPTEQLADLDHMLLDLPGLEPLSLDELARLVPAVAIERCAAAAIEPSSADIDVLGLHQGYVRTGKAAGLSIEASWPVMSIARSGAGFVVATAGADPVGCEQVVVAAGAWSDQVAGLAGARPLGLVPMRRTIAICPTSTELDPEGPMVGDAVHSYYWKPEGPNVLCSPADETPSEPCDARPDEADVALGIDRVNDSTTLALRSVRTAWAGLRTFAPDRVPVCGADPDIAGLWWSAGQGGYGIQTAPAMAALLAGSMLGVPLSAELMAAGVSPDALSSTRFRP